jgi:hypothetical protein
MLWANSQTRIEIREIAAIVKPSEHHFRHSVDAATMGAYGSGRARSALVNKLTYAIGEDIPLQ